ncbi:hypothetical protein DYB32_000029 [Aphanomyces invadans]|uniref:DNA repair protein REV1 n=1 Tax=Aphanomyces invadans TaxID=157072 RepID=A0A418BBC5_9STRA|nr:hypothetical protein DYB32_000029 [Aphanomyces invadans]
MDGRRNPFLPQAKVEAALPQPAFGQQPGSLSFGQYMASKIQKLRSQNDGIKKTSRIFDGVAIYVNGQTEPRKEVLRTMIVQHGGQFEAYMTSRVTHMIAEQLADSKLREIIMKKPLPVVHPKWIVDSIAAGKRVGMHSYIYSRFHDPLQLSFATSIAPVLRPNDHMPSDVNSAIESATISASLPKQASTIDVRTAVANPHRTPIPNRVEASQASTREVVPTVVRPPVTKDNAPHPLQHTPSIVSDATAFSWPSAIPNEVVSSQPRRDVLPVETPDAGSLPPPTFNQTSPIARARSCRPTNHANHPSVSKVQKSTPLFTSTPLSFGQYMKSKIAKLRRQNDQMQSKQTSRVLDGITIYVNGQTKPSKDVLKSLVLMHGGAFESYLTTHVTHMIATHVATSKRVELQYVLVTTPAQVESMDETAHDVMEPSAFVRSFFANSRLHHIGSWKSYYKEHIGDFTSESTVASKDCVFGSCSKEDRVILHVDMDCFFVSVMIRNMPSVYQTLPVAVAHSGYSSLNAVGPPAFSTHDTQIFHRFTPAVQAMSCDEAYLEFPKGTDGMGMARQIRRTILSATKCHASVGVAYNLLLARLATKQAKPNGAFEITPDTASSYINDLPVSELPGVGRVMHAKLEALGIQTCTDLKDWSELALCQHFGAKTSDMLQRYARGRDTRPLELAPMVKSISADVNYGVRLADASAATEFIQALSAEVHDRLVKRGFFTSALTLKLKIRRPDAPVEPVRAYQSIHAKNYTTK